MSGIYTKYLFFNNLLLNRLCNRHTPMYLYWFITENCNLNCSYCYGNFCNKPFDDLVIEDMLRLVEAFARGGVKRISLLGGEPLLYRHIDQVVESLNKHKISCSILTNGTLAVEKINVLKNVEEVGFSIDGSPSVHDSIRGHGNFDQLLKAIAAVKAIGKTIVLTFTIFAENIGELDFVLDFAKEHELFLSVNLAHGRINTEKVLPVSKADYESCQQSLVKIIEAKKRGYPIFRMQRTLDQMLSWPDYAQDSSNVKPRADFPECQFGRFAACVSADGVMSPCFLGTDVSSGKNILEVGFEEAWKHCQTVDHCRYCHVPCFIEYNALLNLNTSVILSIFQKLVLGHRSQ